MGCEGVSGIAGGTFPLDYFYLGFEVGLWIEMVMTLCLLVVKARVCTKHLKGNFMNTLGVKFDHNSNRFMAWLGQAHDGKVQFDRLNHGSI